jgi:ADP-ribose pyrophosphatase YjhB (NUDIX family)
LSRKASGWVSEPLWRQIKASVPIPCVDIIVSNNQGAVLLGWRVIHPYVNVWATPGGRIHLGEGLAEAARRILSSHGLGANGFYLVGVFPIRFPSRFDISVCLAATSFSGSPIPGGTEFTKVGWFKKLPRRTGKNYVEMIERGRRMRKSAYVMKLNRIRPSGR